MFELFTTDGKRYLTRLDHIQLANCISDDMPIEAELPLVLTKIIVVGKHVVAYRRYKYED